MTMTNLARTLPLAAILGGLCLAPALARADSLDCYPPVVTITAPADGDSFEAVTEIPVTVDVQPEGFDAELTRVYVLVDDVEAASLDITASGTHELVVPVTEGSHRLVAGADDDCGGPGTSDPIMVEVTAAAGASTGEPGTGTGGEGGSGDGTTGGGDDGASDDGGCAVARVRTRSWVGMSAFLLAVLGAWRLRRTDP